MTQYIALQPITAGDVLAYNPGDPVHPDNVDANGYEVGVQVAERESAQAVAFLRERGLIPSPEDAAEAETGGAAEQVSAGTFDPADRTVADVNDHLDRYPDDTDRVLKAERDGKSRAGIIHGPHGEPPDVAEG